MVSANSQGKNMSKSLGVFMASSNGITNIAPNQTASPVDTVPLASPNLSIVVPAYNEQAVIGDVIAGLKEELKNKNCEIIVVDDASFDNTFEIAARLGVKVFRHEFNKGYRAALKTGVRHDYVKSFFFSLVMDSIIPKMLVAY